MSSSGLFEKKELNPYKNSLEEENKMKENPENKETKNIIDVLVIKAQNREVNIFDEKANISYFWRIKPKEAIQYLNRTIEKHQMKIIEKERKLEEKQTLIGKKTK